MTDARSLIKQGDDLFGKRGTLLSLWQDIAENFYVERADFTTRRSVGDEFAAGLMTGYPLIVRRELSNAFSAMLRPRDREWFRITTDRPDTLDNAGRAWLERATEIQRRAMYDRQSQFVRATKEGDADFATFGQAVISREIDWKRNTLLYRSWHLRDVAWCEDYSGQVDEVHRKWKPNLRTLAQTFPGKLHQKHVERLAKEPYENVEIRHLVLPTDQYDGIVPKARTPYVSVYLDVENEHIIQSTPSHSRVYTIPRWQTVSGSQYAYSPATVVGLPDARLIQAMTLTLLEAGETAVRPPMIATRDAIRGDIALYAGGVTWADAEYDERLGEVLRPLTQDKRGVPFGMEMSADVREMLVQAFFLNKLSLPPAEGEMTAFETAQRVQEYIRNALPLFEPMEVEYNGGLCEDTFEALMRVGAFGPLDEIPESIRGAEVRFQFESPLHRALEREKSARFEEARALLLQAVEIDPDAVATLDVRKALREAMAGVGVPASWTRDEEVVEQMAAQAEAQRQLMATAQLAEQGGKAAKEISAAEQTAQQVEQARLY